MLKMEENNGSKKTFSVWVCDLTHTYQTLALNRMPLGAGMVAAYYKQKTRHDASLRLFRKIDKLKQALLDGPPPAIIGFTNNVKNQGLNFETAKSIKKKFPETVTVFGGPNIPEDVACRERYIRNHDWIDFYLMYEGEEAFFQLADSLAENDFNVNKVKSLMPRNAAFFHEGKAFTIDPLPRLDVNLLPSPYLQGYFDEFFGEFKPILQFARGCPFKCTFCNLSLDAWDKVYHKSPEYVRKELDYIVKRVGPEVDLMLADSNFGMYKQDLEKCHIIAEFQKNHSWPNYITATTGKNKPERVLEAIKILNGAIITTLAVQSTDERVLEKIKRQNISHEKAFQLAKEVKKISPQVYSDIITPLPGETIESHFNSIKDVIDLGMETVVAHTLMLFEGSEIATEESRRKYKMVTRYRCLPRCFGKYNWLDDEEMTAVEIEEMCVATSTFSFEDYLVSRKFHLTLEIFHNDYFLRELVEVLKYFNVPLFAFLQSVNERALSSDLNRLYDEFVSEVKTELWDSPEQLLEFIRRPGVLEKYKSGEYGSNLILKYKSKALLLYVKEILDVAYNTAIQMIRERNPDRKTSNLHAFLEQLKWFSFYRKTDILDPKKTFSRKFDYSLNDIYDDVAKAITPKKISLKFFHDEKQVKMIEYNKSFYGTNLVGLSKLFAQISAQKFYRMVA